MVHRAATHEGGKRNFARRGIWMGKGNISKHSNMYIYYNSLATVIVPCLTLLYLSGWGPVQTFAPS